MRPAIVDTGPLVAFLDRADRHHRWVADPLEELDPPLLVCEPVLAEAMYLRSILISRSIASIAVSPPNFVNTAWRSWISVIRTIHASASDIGLSRYL